MKVWVIREAEPLASKNSKKFRYLSLTESLLLHSHEVIFIISSFDHFSKKSRTNDEFTGLHSNVTFILLNSISYLKHVSLRRIINQFQLAYSFKQSSRTLDKPDIILCSVPSIQLANEVSKFAKSQNIPFILDIVDLWPDLFQHFLPKTINYIAKPYIGYLRKELINALKYATALTALTESYLQWGLNYIKLPLQLHDVFPLGSESNYLKRNRAVLSVVFVGSITRQFEFDTLFEAVSSLSNVNFSIVGSGDLMVDFKLQTSQLSNLKWTGWLEAKELENQLLSASIAIMPYKNLPHFQKNITNKFSEYLAYGLPILTSVSGEMLDLLEQHQCGDFYSTSEELVQHILEYKTNPDKLKQHSENAQILQRKYFDIDKINRSFVGFIEEVHTRYHNR